jgi:hypothetical protein
MMHIVWVVSDMLDPKSIIILVFGKKSLLILYHQHLLL